MIDAIPVLFLASAPSRTRPPVWLHDHVHAIGQAVRESHAGDRVKLIPSVVGRTRDLQDALLRHDPLIAHLAGHGDDPCVLYLGDGLGRERRVGKEALAMLFGMLREWIRVVIVNGCDTLPTVEALSQRVDYAIGMSRPLSDPSATVFARAFYGALAMGRTVQASFDLAAGWMEMSGRAGAPRPVLRIRAGVDPTLPLLPSPAMSRPGPLSHDTVRA